MILWAECDVVVIAMVTYVVQYLCINSDTDYTSVAGGTGTVCGMLVVLYLCISSGTVCGIFVVLYIWISSSTVCGAASKYQ